MEVASFQYTLSPSIFFADWMLNTLPENAHELKLSHALATSKVAYQTKQLN